MAVGGVLTPTMAAVAAGLEETGWAAELCSPDWTLVYVSSQLRTLLGHPTDEDLGLGRHMVESRQCPAFDRFVSDQAGTGWLRTNVPHMIEATPGGRDAIRAMVTTGAGRRAVDEAEIWQFPVWTSTLAWGPYGDIRYFAQRPRSVDGEEYGTLYLYGSTLPATLLALVARGDAALFERMARLTQPRRREAAVLFADLQSSGSLSRTLPSATYFRVLATLAAALDRVVIAAGGIVGKHAGDGVTAFFLAEDLGGPSRAAAAALAATRGMAAAVAEASEEAGQPLALNVGAHWGGTLYMGQLVTDGRLEVTALGDEVNECARMQQSARDGAILVSKPLLERLDPDDALEQRVDPGTVHYVALADLPTADEKARRDAGALAVTILSH